MLNLSENKVNEKIYWRITPCIDFETKESSDQYYLVIQRDKDTKYAYKYNIYDSKKNKFISDEWYDGAGRGRLHAKYVYVSKSVPTSHEHVYNKMNILNSKLYYKNWKHPEEFFV